MYHICICNFCDFLVKAGIYEIEITASNTLPSSETHSTMIEIIPIISHVSLEREPTIDEVVKPKDEMHFHLEIKGFNDHTCISFNKGDEKNTKLIYGSKLVCAAQSDSTWIGNAFEELNITINYSQPGLYTITLIVFDLLNTITKSLTFTISSVICKPPSLDIIKQHKHFNKPMVLFKSRAIDITGVCEIQCEETLVNSKVWKVYSVDTSSGNDIAEVLLGI